MSSLLLPGGRFYLIIPDKRKTFDYFRPLTTISDVLLTHIQDPAVHTLHNVVEAECETTHSNAVEVSRGEVLRHVMKSTLTSETLLINDCIDRVVMKYMYAAAQGEYIDVHRWVFSDEWFLELMEALHSLGVLPDLTVETLYPTCSEEHCSEFYVVM